MHCHEARWVKGVGRVPPALLIPYARKQIMSFVNAYVSEDDIKKYRLNEVLLSYTPGRDSLLSSFRHHWSIDRERKIFFIVVGGTGERRTINFALYAVPVPLVR